MKLGTSILAATLLVTTSVRASAQESAVELARKLGNRTFGERESAAKKLEQLGAAALPALRASLSSADLETRRRAVELMERIEERVLKDEAQNASPIQLRFTKTPIVDALHAVQKQTGLRVGSVEGPREVTLDTGKVPYWQAWRAFCKSADVVERDLPGSAAKLRRFQASDIIALELPPDPVKPVALPMLGIFAIPPIEFVKAKENESPAEDDRHSLRVRVRWHSLDNSLVEKQTLAVFAVEIRPEPRLEIASLPRVELTKYVDAKGNVHVAQPTKLLPAELTPDSTLVLANEFQFGGIVQMKPILWQGSPAPLRELHGIVRTEVMARPVMLEIANVLKSVGQQVRGDGGLTMTLLRAERIRDQVHLRLRCEQVDSLLPRSAEPLVVRIRPGVLGVMGAMDVAMRRLELRDNRGWKCAVVDANYESAEDGKGYLVNLTYEAPEDCTLVLTKAPRRVAIEVPFVVREVGMPPK